MPGHGGLPNRDQGACEELQSVIEEVTAQPMNRFVDELNRTLTFLRQQRRALAPEKLVLFGCGATVGNISQFLCDKLDLPVEPWRLEGAETLGNAGHAVPLPLLGPAIALSSLAWSTP